MRLRQALHAFKLVVLGARRGAYKLSPACVTCFAPSCGCAAEAAELTKFYSFFLLDDSLAAFTSSSGPKTLMIRV